jgi:dimethylargininase
MLTAIVRKPSRNLSKGELTFLSRKKLDFEKAAKQHQAYCDALKELGARVITLDAVNSLPDSVFVEDTALVLDEIAVIVSIGAKSRIREVGLMEATLSKFRSASRIKPPARIDGGDILRVGKKLFVGNSTRTNKKGIRALHKFVNPFGYEVIRLKIDGSLHLKTGCTALDDRTILINPDWVDATAFRNFEQIEVAKSEPFAANILRIGKTICLHSGFENTKKIVEDRGYKIKEIDISEFLKAEAGLTCMSLIFNADN